MPVEYILSNIKFYASEFWCSCRICTERETENHGWLSWHKDVPFLSNNRLLSTRNIYPDNVLLYHQHKLKKNPLSWIQCSQVSKPGFNGFFFCLDLGSSWQYTGLDFGREVGLVWLRFSFSFKFSCNGCPTFVLEAARSFVRVIWGAQVSLRKHMYAALCCCSCCCCCCRWRCLLPPTEGSFLASGKMPKEVYVPVQLRDCPRSSLCFYGSLFSLEILKMFRDMCTNAWFSRFGVFLSICEYRAWWETKDWVVDSSSCSGNTLLFQFWVYLV